MTQVLNTIQEKNFKLTVLSRIRGIKNYTDINPGKTILFIKLYQESGQTTKIYIKIEWDGKNNINAKIL